MKNKIIFPLVLILSINSFLCDKISAQYLDPVINPVWEYYSTNVLSSVSAGKGNTGVASSGDVSMIYLNPATLNLSEKFQINAGYNLRTKSTYSLRQNFYSFSLVGAYRLNKNLQVGVAYQNDYSYDYSPSIVIDWPYTNTLETHSFRMPLVYNYKWLRIGMNLNLSYIHGSSFGCITESMWKFNPEFGTVITPIKEVSFGASFIPGFTNNSDVINNCSGTNTYTSIVKFPNRFKAGTEVRLNNNELKLSLDYHYSNTSIIPGLKDQSNFYLGLDYLIDEIWTIRGGFFTVYDIEERTYQSWYNYDLYFFTFGFTYKIHNYSLNLSAQSSLYGNASSRTYSVINFGAGFEF